MTHTYEIKNNETAVTTTMSDTSLDNAIDRYCKRYNLTLNTKTHFGFYATTHRNVKLYYSIERSA
jgi:hypothetical protein